MDFPNDSNGDVLRRMESHGVDFSQPRNIDFTVVFANQTSAEKFAEHFRALGHEVSVREAGVANDFPWGVLVVNLMVPSYDGISNFEDLLQSVADGLGGHNDGWGCLSGPT